VAPEHHHPGVVRLLQVFLGFQNAVDPTGHGNAGLVDHHAVLAVGACARHHREPTLQPVQFLFPDARPVGPRTIAEPVIAGQRIGEHAQIGRALHIVMAAEDVGAAAGRAHVAKGQLQDAVGAGVVVAVGVLGAAHAPDQRGGTVLRHRAGNAVQLRTWHARDLLDFLRRPFRHFGADLIHAPDAALDELLVLPAVLEDVVEDAPDQRHVGARPEAHILVGMRRGAREAWIENDQRSVVFFLGLQ